MPNKYYEKNKDKILKRQREAYKKHKENNTEQYQKIVISRRRSQDKRLYGISKRDSDVLHEKRLNGTCMICEKHARDDRKGKLCLDHCHDSNKIRGILCNDCNQAIGFLKDSAELMEKAIQYIKNSPHMKVKQECQT